MAIQTFYPSQIKALSGGTAYSGTETTIPCGTTAGGITYRTRMEFAPLNALGPLKSLKFNYRRGDGYAGRTVNVGTSATATTTASTNHGTTYLSQTNTWQVEDFTAYKDAISAFTETWYLWLWATTTGAYADLYKTMYLEVETEDGSVYIGVNGVWVKCAVYQGVSDAWQRVAPYFGESGAWKQIGG